MGWFKKIKKKVKESASKVKKKIQKSGYEAGKKVAKVVKKEPTPKPPTITAPTPKIDMKKPAAETIKAIDKPTTVSAKPISKAPVTEVVGKPPSALPTEDKPYEEMAPEEQKEAREEAAQVEGVADVTAQDVAMGLGVGGAGAVVKKSSAGLIAGIKAAARTRSINNLAAKTGLSVEKITKIILKAEMKGGVTGIINSMSAKSLAATVTKYGTILAGTNGMIAWYAMDNVVTGQKFFLNDILEKVESGEINPIDARNRVAENQKTMATATHFLNISTMINPLLWPFRNLIMMGVEADKEANNLKTDSILAAAADAEAKGGVAEEETFEESGDRDANEDRKRDLGWREDDKLYYDNLAITARNLQLTQRTADDLHKLGVAKDKRDLILKQQKEDDDWFKARAKERRDLELVWMQEDMEFYKLREEEKVKEWENRQRSKLRFGIV